VTNLTTLEIAVLDCIARNTYQPVNGDVPDTFEDTSSIWSRLILDSSSTYVGTIRPRSLPGVVASLSKKGLVTTYEDGKDSTVALTRAGFEAWEAEQAKGTV
jgi:hypothetical protein